MEYITPALRRYAVRIETIEPDPANPRKHSRRNLDAIMQSLAKFKQQKPIVIDRRNRIIAGHATYEAAVGLGWEFVAACRSELAGTLRKAFAIGDNRTGELAGWEDAELSTQLDAILAESEELLKATGFEPEDLAKLTASPAGGEESWIEDFHISPPAEVTWILIGVPLDSFAEARPHLAALQEIAAIDVEVSRSVDATGQQSS